MLSFLDLCLHFTSGTDNIIEDLSILDKLLRWPRDKLFPGICTLLMSGLYLLLNVSIIVIDIVRLALLSQVGQNFFFSDHETGRKFVKSLVSFS